MARKESLLIALSAAAVASPLSAMAQAPAAPPHAKYCMRVEPVTGSRIESIECWTRAEWAEQGVDVDKDWPTEGVRVLDA